jgi:hypothetical protein
VCDDSRGVPSLFAHVDKHVLVLDVSTRQTQLVHEGQVGDGLQIRRKHHM